MLGDDKEGDKAKLNKKDSKLNDNSSEENIYISNIAKLFALGLAALMIVGAFFAISNSELIPTDFIFGDDSNTIVLGNNSDGIVSKNGPYGNTTSSVKVAYITGVHPKEFELHDKFEKLFSKKEEHLNYCYYIYEIEVNPEVEDYEDGRMCGQLLAEKYVVPDIINNSFNFAIDLHYNIGSWGYANFVFVPDSERNNNSKYAENIAYNFVDRYDWASYFTPNGPTSPKYVTIPLNEGNVSSMLYEGYAYEEEEIVLNHLNDLIDWVDNYPFNNTQS